MASNNLKEILVSEGIKQVELANKINVSAGTINKVCSKKLTPSPTFQNKITSGINNISNKTYNVDDVFSMDNLF